MTTFSQIKKTKYLKTWRKKLQTFVPRKLKYTIVAEFLNILISRTNLLDGKGRPPKFIEYGGEGDFFNSGNNMIGLMSKRANLKDGICVTEIGCGIGRMPVAISNRFSEIKYVGFDIVKYGISWCQKFFNRKRLPYHFYHANIYNGFYNPKGTQSAQEYVFPIPDGSQDLIFATSVFTHMPIDEIRHYLNEIYRCLKPDGMAYFTCFQLDHAARSRISQKTTLFSFQNEVSGYYVESIDEPELAIAYDDLTFSTLARGARLEILNFFPGSWRGEHSEAFQDAYLLKRVNN